MAAFLKATADKAFACEDNHRPGRPTYPRMAVEKIKIKPDMKERFQRIIGRLKAQLATT